MSRIRSIKPEFWTSAQVLECSRNARLLFLGLWNFCDDTGRHPWNPKQAKAEVFPADELTEADIERMLQELATHGLIACYEFENKRYFYVTGWKHQRIDKPQPSKYPDPFAEYSKSIPRTFPPDRIGEDKKGKKDSSSSNGASAPSDDGQFESFYQAYPRKIGKKAAQRSFAKAIKETTLDRMLCALEKQKRNWHDPKFIPHPATWLNQGRYDDEPFLVSRFPVAR